MLLNKLEVEFLNKEFNLVDLDNKVQSLLNKELESPYYVGSIYDCDVRQMLENSFCYQTEDNEGFNFEFEIVEDNEDVLNIVVKVISIEEV